MGECIARKPDETTPAAARALCRKVCYINAKAGTLLQPLARSTVTARQRPVPRDEKNNVVCAAVNAHVFRCMGGGRCVIAGTVETRACHVYHAVSSSSPKLHRPCISKQGNVIQTVQNVRMTKQREPRDTR